jgi:hypothetical protein
MIILKYECAGFSANEQKAVARSLQGRHRPACFIARQLNSLYAAAVKSGEAGIRTKPQKPVVSLRDGPDIVGRQPVKERYRSPPMKVLHRGLRFLRLAGGKSEQK